MTVLRDVKSLLDKAFGRGLLSRDGVNYALRCPACADPRAEKKKLIVRLDDGRFHCWVCGTKGSNIVAFIARHRPGLVDGVQRLRLKKKNVELTEDIYISLSHGK